VLDILTLGAAQGTEIRVEAVGNDAHAAVEELEQLVASGFPVPEKPDEASETQA